MPSLDDPLAYLSMDEGVPVNLSCQASQFVGLDDPITFGWFKVKGQSEVRVPTDGIESVKLNTKSQSRDFYWPIDVYICQSEGQWLLQMQGI